MEIAYLGEILALLTAVFWGTAVVLFKKSGEKVHPIALNIFKNLMATVLLVPTMLILGQELSLDVSTKHYLLLLLSGALGIGLSDTLFFMSLNRLGASLSAVVSCLYSPSIILLSIIFLNENFSALQILGASFILSAILITTNKKARGDITRSDLIAGILLHLSAILIAGIGIIIIKPFLNELPLLWTNEIRLIGSLLVLIPTLFIHPKRTYIIDSLLYTKSWKYVISGSFIGTYIAMICWLGGIKFTQVSIAAVLNQTSHIFIFIFAAIFLKEYMNIRKVIAIILASMGVWVVIFGG